jgi:hypothetical protein
MAAHSGDALSHRNAVGVIDPVVFPEYSSSRVYGICDIKYINHWQSVNVFVACGICAFSDYQRRKKAAAWRLYLSHGMTPGGSHGRHDTCT